MYRTKAIYQLSDLKQSSWKILRLFEIYRQSGSQAPVAIVHCPKIYNACKLFIYKDILGGVFRDILGGIAS